MEILNSEKCKKKTEAETEMEKQKANKKQCSTGTGKLKLSQWDTSLQWCHCNGALEKRSLQNLPLMEVAQRQRSMEMRGNVAVVVVGAGMAGLSTADALLRCGFKNVTVLEASDRIGGRIHTVSYGPEPYECFDLGASELDYPKEWNTVFTLAKNNGMLADAREHGALKASRHSEHTPMCISCDNNNTKYQYSDRQVCLYENVVDHEISTLRELKTKGRDNSNIQLSSKDYFRETLCRIDRHLTSKYGNDLSGPRVTSAVGDFCRDVQYQHGDDLGEADIQRLILGNKTSSYSLQQGMVSVIRLLTKRFKPGTVKYKARVNHIDWSGFTVKNVRDGNDLKVKVTCSDGRIFKADHLIITAPLGWLKSKSRSSFTPPLKESKLRAIENIGFGAVSKAFIQFEEHKFEKGFYYTFSTNKHHIQTKTKVERNLISMTAKPSSSIVKFLFSNSTPERMNNDDLLSDLTTILESCLRYTLPKPIELTTTNWANNPFYGGTHPYLKTSTSKDDIDMLAKPITFRSKPLIQFAGDATHEDYTCLLHAARASGLREANRLKKIYYYGHLPSLENSNVKSGIKII